MNLGEIITAFRYKTEDQTTPYKWSDAEITYYTNQIIWELCEKCRLIKDSSTTAICQISVIADTDLYTYDSRILEIEKPIRYGDDRIAIYPINRTEVFQYSQSWETVESGKPTHYMLDYESNKIRLYPIPTENTTLYLTVYRAPSADLVSTTLTGTPEIKARYHYYLLEGILYHAYQKDDDNTLDLEQSTRNYQKFQANIEDIMRIENKFYDLQTTVPMPTGYY